MDGTAVVGERSIVERVAAVLDEHRESYDSDCGYYFGCECGWDNGTDEHNAGYAEHVAATLLGLVAEEANAAHRALSQAVQVALDRKCCPDMPDGWYCEHDDHVYLSDANARLDDIRAAHDEHGTRG